MYTTFSLYLLVDNLLAGSNLQKVSSNIIYQRNKIWHTLHLIQPLCLFLTFKIYFESVERIVSEVKGRRKFIKLIGMGFLAGATSGVLGSFWLRDSGKNQDFDPLYFEGEGFAVERVDDEEFRVIDTRYGSYLPPDRMPYLHKIVGNLQNKYSCDISDAREQNNDLIVKVDNPQCFFEARDKIQEEQK